jgi:predicted regulator of Ras-like GTPase activity (Roadblock/LC7/MglB family)
MNFTGEVLASESNDQNIDLDLMGATFNDIFREAHGACKKIGLEACTEAIIQTPKGTIVMRCSGADEEPHLHAIAILSTDGNYALMKMIMAKVLPKAKSELE